jgi:hypothetical protein
MNELLEKMIRAEEITRDIENIKKDIPQTTSKFAQKLMSTKEVDLNLLRSIGAKECSFFTEVGVVTCNFIEGTVKIFVDEKYDGFKVPYKGKLIGSGCITFIFEDEGKYIGDMTAKISITLTSNNKLILSEFTVENNA